MRNAAGDTAYTGRSMNNGSFFQTLKNTKPWSHPFSPGSPIEPRGATHAPGLFYQYKYTRVRFLIRVCGTGNQPSTRPPGKADPTPGQTAGSLSRQNCPVRISVNGGKPGTAPFPPAHGCDATQRLHHESLKCNHDNEIRYRIAGSTRARMPARPWLPGASGHTGAEPSSAGTCDRRAP
jgi:hypothetical protein